MQIWGLNGSVLDANQHLQLLINIPTASIQERTLVNFYMQINTAAEKYGLVYSWEITDVEIVGDMYTLVLNAHQIPTKIGSSGNLFDIEAQHNLFCECVRGDIKRIDKLNNETRNKLRASNNNLINAGATISGNSKEALAPKEITKKINSARCDVRIEADVKAKCFLPNGNIYTSILSITGFPKKNNNKKNLTLIPPPEFIETLEDKRGENNLRVPGTVPKGSDLSKNEVKIDGSTAIKLCFEEANTLILVLEHYSDIIEEGTISPNRINSLIDILTNLR